MGANETTIPESFTRITLAQYLTTGVEQGLFKEVSQETPDLHAGEVAIAVDYVQMAMALTDLMREDSQIPMPSFAIGDTVGGGLVGRVAASRSSSLNVGDFVVGSGGWTELAIGPAEHFSKIDLDAVPSPAYYLNQGVTAYYGMVNVADVGEGDVVYVSGAAGGVGSLAGQIAKCCGATTVIGSAGTDKKVAFLTEELGFDKAFNYNDGDIVESLHEAAPDGITVFYDNVGGDQFEAAIKAARPHARLALCGAISSQIDHDQSKWPRLDLMTAITKHLEILPFACYHTPEQIQAWTDHFGQWLSEGKLKFPHEVVEGTVSEAPRVLEDLVSGKHAGSVALKLK